MVDTEYKYISRLNWQNGDSVSKWNEKCAWAIETFGLPGDRFVCHACDEYMEFYFKNEVDAIHFSLVCL
jgi:hypothetical protein